MWRLLDPVFRKGIDGLAQARQDIARASAWFQKIHAQSPLSCVAYFSMEFMLSEAHRHVFEVELFLNGLEPDGLRVEIYADEINGGDQVRQEMTWLRTVSDPTRQVYRATISITRSADDYTVRLIPRCAGAAIPLECARILWQR